MIDREIEIAMPDGRCGTFISHPERGGPFPVVLFYMDALFAFIATETAAGPGPAGAVGYRMSGRHAISAAVYFKDRVKAAAEHRERLLALYRRHLGS